MARPFPLILVTDGHLGCSIEVCYSLGADLDVIGPQYAVVLLIVLTYE